MKLTKSMATKEEPQVPVFLFRQHTIYENRRSHLHDACHMCNWFLENTRDCESLKEYAHVIKGFRESFIDYCDKTYFPRLGNYPDLLAYVKECHKSVLEFATDVTMRVEKLIFELTMHEQISEQLAESSEDESAAGSSTCSSEVHQTALVKQLEKDLKRGLKASLERCLESKLDTKIESLSKNVAVLSIRKTSHKNMVTIPRVHARVHKEFLKVYRELRAVCLLGYRLYHFISEVTLNLLLNKIVFDRYKLIGLCGPFHHSSDSFSEFMVRGLDRALEKSEEVMSLIRSELNRRHFLRDEEGFLHQQEEEHCRWEEVD